MCSYCSFTFCFLKQYIFLWSTVYKFCIFTGFQFLDFEIASNQINLYLISFWVKLLFICFFKSMRRRSLLVDQRTANVANVFQIANVSHFIKCIYIEKSNQRKIFKAPLVKNKLQLDCCFKYINMANLSKLIIFQIILISDSLWKTLGMINTFFIIKENKLWLSSVYHVCFYNLTPQFDFRLQSRLKVCSGKYFLNKYQHQIAKLHEIVCTNYLVK